MCVPGGLIEPFEAAEGVEGVERDMSALQYFLLSAFTDARLCTVYKPACVQTGPSAQRYALQINRQIPH